MEAGVAGIEAARSRGYDHGRRHLLSRHSCPTDGVHLNLRGLRFAWYVVLGDNYCTSFGDHVSFCYFRFANDSVRLCTRFKNTACGLSSLAVNISCTLPRSENPVFCAVNACMGRFFCNWQVPFGTVDLDIWNPASPVGYGGR